MMKDDESLIMPKLFTGKNSFALFAKEVTHKNVIFLTYPQISVDMRNKLKAAFPDKETKFISYPFGYPDISELNNFHAAFWSDIDASNTILIGFGGGSVLDCAKVLRFNHLNQNWLTNTLDKPFNCDDFIKLSLALIPTTSGTGSEVTPTATIWNKQHSLKHSFYGESVYADCAVINGEFSIGNSWLASRDAALDALSHALEALWNVNRTLETNEYAILSARIITQSLPKLQNNLENETIRDRLSFGSLLAGLAMSKTQTALAHALSYELTLKSHITHGAAVAYWLPYTWQLLLESQDKAGKSLILKALEKIGTKPQYFADWLNSLGVLTHSLQDNSFETRNKINKTLNSARGKNFIMPPEFQKHGVK